MQTLRRSAERMSGGGLWPHQHLSTCTPTFTNWKRSTTRQSSRTVKPWSAEQPRARAGSGARSLTSDSWHEANSTPRNQNIAILKGSYYLHTHLAGVPEWWLANSSPGLLHSKVSLRELLNPNKLPKQLLFAHFLIPNWFLCERLNSNVWREALSEVKDD